MKKGESSLSFAVLAGLILLFLIFIIIEPTPSGNLSFDLSGTEGDSSLTLIIAVGVLLAVLGILFVVYKKMKQRKKIPSAPNIESGKKREIDDLDRLFEKREGMPNTKKHEENKIPPLNPEGYEQPQPHREQPQYNEPKNHEIPSLEEVNNGHHKKQQPIPPYEKQTDHEDKKINLEPIKQMIRNLIRKNYNHDQLVKYLQSQGLNPEDISKAIEEINIENLKLYIQESLQKGFKKEQIIQLLKSNGWNPNIIEKAFT